MKYKNNTKLNNTEIRLQRIENRIEKIYEFIQDFPMLNGSVMERWMRDKIGEDWEEKLKELNK